MDTKDFTNLLLELWAANETFDFWKIDVKRKTLEEEMRS